MDRNAALLLGKRSCPFNRGAGWGSRGALCTHRSRPWFNENQPVPLAVKSQAGCRQGPGNALRPEKRKLHTCRSTLQPPGTPPGFRIPEAERGRNRQRGPKSGLGDNRDSQTLAVPRVDPGTKKPDAGTNRVSGAMGAGRGHRTMAEPRLKGTESGEECFNLHPAPSFIPSVWLPSATVLD